MSETLRYYVAMSVGAGVVGLGVGLALSMLLLGISEGINWAWWQIVLATMIGTAGAATVVASGMLAWALIIGLPLYEQPTEDKEE